MTASRINIRHTPRGVTIRATGAAAQALADAITRAAKMPIALSLVDVATGLPVRRFASGADAPGRKEAVR